MIDEPDLCERKYDLLIDRGAGDSTKPLWFMNKSIAGQLKRDENG